MSITHREQSSQSSLIRNKLFAEHEIKVELSLEDRENELGSVNETLVIIIKLRQIKT